MYLVGFTSFYFVLCLVLFVFTRRSSICLVVGRSFLVLLGFVVCFWGLCVFVVLGVFWWVFGVAWVFDFCVCFVCVCALCVCVCVCFVCVCVWGVVFVK